MPIYRAGEKWARLLATYEIILGDQRSRRRAPTATRRSRCIARSSSCARRSWARSRWRSPGRPRPTSCGPATRRCRRTSSGWRAEAEAWEELAEIYQAEVAQGDRRGAQDRALSPAGAHRADAAAQARRGAQVVRGGARSARPRTPRRCGNLEQIHTQAGNYKELLDDLQAARARAPTRSARGASRCSSRSPGSRRSSSAIRWRRRRPIASILEADKTPATQTRALARAREAERGARRRRRHGRGARAAAGARRQGRRGHAARAVAAARRDLRAQPRRSPIARSSTIARRSR